jgi:hypothetical protein
VGNELSPFLNVSVCGERKRAVSTTAVAGNTVFLNNRCNVLFIVYLLSMSITQKKTKEKCG